MNLVTWLLQTHRTRSNDGERCIGTSAVVVHQYLETDEFLPTLRFNIWNTNPDPSFQRIAHLVKLVFNTKIVVISLIDENEE